MNAAGGSRRHSDVGKRGFIFNHLSICTLSLLVAILAAGCRGGGPEDGPGARGPERAAGEGDLSGRPVEPAVPVAAEVVKRGPIASYYSATATLAPEKEAEILARVSGVILELLCEEGDLVHKGQPLLRIEDDEYRLRLEQAEASRADLMARHKRAKEMLAQGLVSAEEYEAVDRDLKSAEAEEELARLNLSYARVTAPFDGRVVERLVDVGQTLNIGMSLFRLADFDPLLARVHVPAREFRQLQPDQPVELLLTSNGARMHGRITLVSPVIDEASGTIKVTIEIPEYPADTRPGDFAEVRIVTEEHTDAVLVPKIAVVSDRGEQVVYVAADSLAERRVVELGFEDDTDAEIISGVNVGDLVVVRGQRSLKHGSPIKFLDEEAITLRRPPAEGVVQGKPPRHPPRRRGS